MENIQTIKQRFGIIGNDPKLNRALEKAAQVAPTEYESLHSQIHKGILENYKEVRLFWQQYENKAEPVFKASYDAFLKANKQSQGINSYDLVVGFLIPHYVRN